MAKGLAEGLTQEQVEQAAEAEEEESEEEIDYTVIMQEEQAVPEGQQEQEE